MAQIDKTYHELLNKILKEGYTYEDPKRKGVKRIQIPNYTFVHNFSDGFPAISTKKLAWKSVVGELIWILKGDTNIKYLVDNGINIWNKDAYNYHLEKAGVFEKLPFEDFIKFIKRGHGGLGDLGRVYGYQLRNFGGEFDQLDWIINLLKTTPMATKKTVTFMNPCDKDQQALTPCHTGFKILVKPLRNAERCNLLPKTTYNLGTSRVNELTDDIPKYQFYLQWEQDSVDTFLGLPFNIASYATLAHIIGKMTNMIPKGVIGDLSNVHIYEPHIEKVKEQLRNDVDKYDNCELELPNHCFQNIKVKSRPWNLNDFQIDKCEISDFKLKDYKSYPYIKAEMLAYNK